MAKPALIEQLGAAQDGPPRIADPHFEWVRDGVLLVRGAAAPAGDPGWIVDAAAGAAGGTSTAVVLVPPLGVPLSRLAQLLGGQLPASCRVVVLVSGDTAAPDRTGEVPAQVLANWLQIEVVAPDGPLLAIPDGSLFVLGEGSRVGWWLFRADARPIPLGPRYPAPPWQALLPEVVRQPPPGLVVEQVPAGLWLRAAGKADPGDPAYAAPAARQDLTLLVSRPGDRPVPVETVGWVLAMLPEQLRRRTVLSFCGPVATPANDVGGRAAPGPVLAARLGEPVRCNTGVPVLVGGVRQVAAVADGGHRTWHPFAQQVRYLPAAETTPEVTYWRDPAPRFAPGVHGLVSLNRHWVAEVVEAGLWVRPARRPVGGRLVRRLGVDPQSCLVILGDLNVSTTGLPWRAATKLLRVLAPDARARMRAALPYSATDELAQRAALACGDLLAGQPVHRIEWDGAIVAWPTQSANGKKRQASRGSTMEASVAGGGSAGPATVERGVAGGGAGRVAGRATPAPPADAPRHLKPPPSQAEPPRPAWAAETQTPRPAWTQAPPAAPTEAAPLAAASATTDLPGSATPNQASTPDQPTFQTLDTPAPAPAPPAQPGPAPMHTVFAPAQAPTAERAASPAPAAPAPAPAPTPGTAPAPAAPAQPPIAPVARRLTAAELTRPSSPAERAVVRSALGWQYDAHAGAVNRMLAERPGLRFAVAADGDEAVVTELVAVRAYLAEDSTALVETMRTGVARVDPAVVVCVASGLRRLAAHSGPVFAVVPAGAGGRGLYRPGQTFTESGFAVASIDPRMVVTGEAELMVWSVTGRRLAGLFSGEADSEVVFPAGTRFLVLAVEPVPVDDPPGAPQVRVFARELTAAESGASAAADRGDERTLLRLHRSAQVRDGLSTEARLQQNRPGRLDWVIETAGQHR